MTNSAEAGIMQAGEMAASMINTALGGMAYGSNPWQVITSNLLTPKPHKAGDRGYQALLTAQKKHGKLKLMNFRRVKQLGAGALRW